MKRKYLSLPIAGLLAAGGLWFAWSTWRSNQLSPPPTTTRPGASQSKTNPSTREPAESSKANTEADFKTPDGPKPGRELRPPDQARRFMDFTPEERVEFARKGHGPGG